MRSFRRFLTEKVSSGKNTHLTHIEDNIFEDGAAGGLDSLNFLDSTIEMLAGTSESRVNISTKWDGAPAIVAGTDPESGRFFVATKSAFNVIPKVNYTSADIRRNHSGGVVDKLEVALQELPKLGIKGIMQGDMMFGPGDVKRESIDGESFLTFTPNTITYAASADSDLAREIGRARMGIVFHTSYNGKTLRDLKASYGVSTSGLRKTASVWVSNASFKNVSGRALFTHSETQEARLALAEARAKFQSARGFADVLQRQSGILEDLNVFINEKVKKGAIDFASGEFFDWFMRKWNVEIGELKTPAGKQVKRGKKDEQVGFLIRNKAEIDKILSFRSAVTRVKELLIRKLETLQGLGTFLRTDDGFKVTAPEGFVAVDTLSNKALKLVDRLEFSRANFTAAKNWV